MMTMTSAAEGRKNEVANNGNDQTGKSLPLSPMAGNRMKTRAETQKAAASTP